MAKPDLGPVGGTPAVDTTPFAAGQDLKAGSGPLEVVLGNSHVKVRGVLVQRYFSAPAKQWTTVRDIIITLWFTRHFTLPQMLEAGLQSGERGHERRPGTGGRRMAIPGVPRGPGCA